MNNHIPVGFACRLWQVCFLRCCMPTDDLVIWCFAFAATVAVTAASCLRRKLKKNESMKRQQKKMQSGKISF